MKWQTFLLVKALALTILLKVASNIGYTREDKKWITEYYSAFFCFK